MQGDPRWITTNKPGECAGCRRKIPKREKVFFLSQHPNHVLHRHRLRTPSGPRLRGPPAGRERVLRRIRIASHSPTSRRWLPSKEPLCHRMERATRQRETGRLEDLPH